MSGKLARAVQLGALATDLARQSRGADSSSQLKTRVVERLASLHGIPQKIGQILALNELGASEQVYTSLTEGKERMSAREAFDEMSRALGRPVEECFSHIEASGVSASLGQVHRARLHDGREVAIKIQYPSIGDALALDLFALGWLTAPVGGLNRGFNLSAYRREIGGMLQQELDYSHEALAMREFGEAAARTLPFVRVPQVLDELSGSRILTMTWLQGEHFSTACQWPFAERRKLAEAMLEVFLTSCFAWRHVHADPHPGNYRFVKTDSQPLLGLLDFGCVKKLPAAVPDGLRGIVGALRNGKLSRDPLGTLQLYEALGFDVSLLVPICNKLAPLSKCLFEPFLENRYFMIHDWNLGPRVEAILGDSRWNFRMAGPAELIYFMRAFQGLTSYLRALDAPVNWYEAYDRVLATAPHAVTVLPAAWQEQEPATQPLSGLLRIRVHENGETKIEVTFRSVAAENLPDLVPPELGDRLTQRNIDVAAIARRAVAENYPPGELFRLQEGSKDYRVWLE